MGIHAVPPGETDNVIVANVTPSKNGKKSSAADLEKLAVGKPMAVRLEQDKVFNLLIPITDSEGRDLNGGFVAIEVPYSKANNEEDDIKIATITGTITDPSGRRVAGANFEIISQHRFGTSNKDE